RDAEMNTWRPCAPQDAWPDDRASATSSASQFFCRFFDDIFDEGLTPVSYMARQCRGICEMKLRPHLRQSPAIEGYLAMTGPSLLRRPRGMERDQGEELLQRIRREMERDPQRIGHPASRPAEDERRRQIAELIGACAAGDRPAFRQLYDLTSRFVCGII